MALNQSIQDLESVFKTLTKQLGLTNDENYKWDETKFVTTGIGQGKPLPGNAPDFKANAEEISNKCKGMQNLDVYTKTVDAGEKNFWNNGGGRAVMDVAGAAVLGTAGGITTAQIMKANNRANFTAEQQKWMDEIGSKIHCYVGGQWVGDFGDIVSVDISEE